MAPKRKSSALHESSVEQPTLRRSSRARGTANADKSSATSSAQDGDESPKVVAKDAKRQRPKGHDKAISAEIKIDSVRVLALCDNATALSGYLAFPTGP